MKRKTLPKDFKQMLEKRADLATLQAVFDNCEIDARGGYSKETAFLMAKCPDDLARWLAASGADIAAVDSFGNSALHIRARSCQSNLKVLIDLGCDLNAHRASGETPLHAAADAANANAVELLLAAGATVDATNREGLTPLELALRGCSNVALVDMVVVSRLLLAAGARKTPIAKGFVQRIGETFEFHRSNFNPDFVDEASAALTTLCEIFEVKPPVRRQMHDGISTIRATTSTWQKQHKELWDLLVPSTGPAATIQGEVIRISGRIGDELERNGGTNWDADYEKMARAFLDLVRNGTPLPEDQARDGERVIGAIIKDRAGDTDRLAELAVAWVMLNPKPIQLGKVAYSR